MPLKILKITNANRRGQGGDDAMVKKIIEKLLNGIHYSVVYIHFRNKSRRKKWRKKNKHNTTICSSYRSEQIQVGNFSYGIIDAGFINSYDKLIIGNCVSIAAGVKFLLGGNHRMDTISTFPMEIITHTDPSLPQGDIVVGDDVWIGMDALLLSGAKIGQGAVIGARAVVTKPIPPYAVVVGNPARIIRYRFSEDIIEQLLRIDFSSFDEDFFRTHLKEFCTPIQRSVPPLF